MTTLTAVAATLCPVLLWGGLFAHLDRRRWALVPLLAAVGAGLAAVGPVAAAQHLLLAVWPAAWDDVAARWAETIVVAGAIEEGAKLLATLLLVAVNGRLTAQPPAVSVLAIGVALGFTASEDWLRHSEHLDPWRALRVPGHVLFAAVWCYPLERRQAATAVAARRRWLAVTVVAWLIAVLAHGVWDVLAVMAAAGRNGLIGVMLALQVTLAWILLDRLQRPATMRAGVGNVLEPPLPSPHAQAVRRPPLGAVSGGLGAELVQEADHLGRRAGERRAVELAG